MEQSKAARAQFIDAAFNKFITDQPDAVLLTLLESAFNAAMHPKVIDGTWTDKQAFDDFVRTVGPRRDAARISREEWRAHWNKVSAKIDEDEYFGILMTQLWQI